VNDDRAVPSDLGQELTQGFAGRYIGYKARQLVGRYGYVTTDVADLEQELRLRLFQRLPKFDGSRGPWNSFVVAVVDRQVASLASRHLTRSRWEAVQRMPSQSASEMVAGNSGDDEESALRKLPPAGRGERTELDLVDLRHDIAVIVPHLPPELQDVWYWLQYDNVRAAARGLCVSPMTIYHRLRRLQAAFLAAERKHFCKNSETPGRWRR
jgi:DNA-directed RNA polymerase specialized sigma24 family protein